MRGRNRFGHRLSGAVWALLVFGGSVGTADATPQFARQHGVSCEYCHVAPPRLNQRGEDFLAGGYRLDLSPAPRAPRATFPLAVWNTFDVEYRESDEVTKGFPSRVELISAGRVGRTRAWYFVELRALSQQIGAGNRLLNRSGRFEDLFIALPLDSRGAFTLTTGQFRALSQVDVSRRLSLSEPLAFGASIADPRRATSARLTSLRAFSPSGRQPAIRLMYQRSGGRGPADGWYSGLTVPLGGELTLPFTDAASFELEGRPKGAFAESFYRTGMTTVGGHLFVGDERAVGSLVITSDLTRRWSAVSAVGLDRSRGVTAARYSIGGEYSLTPRLVVGSRLDHRTAQRRDPSVHAYADLHVPFGPMVWRQALRLQLEQTFQSNNFRTAFGLSHIF